VTEALTVKPLAKDVAPLLSGSTTMHSQLSYRAARELMVRRQLVDRGITDPRVLEAMSDVPRERFVPTDERHEAYADRALPIAAEQTISQPYIVALMTQALQLSGSETVLEVGTGSGYQTAILTHLARQVVSIERCPELRERAAEVLEELHCTNFRLLLGDGAKGWPHGAPYDRIIVTAAANQVPPALAEQLAEGGIMAIPLGDAESQELVILRKKSGQFETSGLTHCRFVPLVGSFEPSAKEIG
jgi:protein-L-isoaspartate(D-aspartate) O-methyltransferase